MGSSTTAPAPKWEPAGRLERRLGLPDRTIRKLIRAGVIGVLDLPGSVPMVVEDEVREAVQRFTRRPAQPEPQPAGAA